MHDLPLITTVAAAFATAWVLGLITQRLRLSPIVGYLLAGVLIGPNSPGFVGDITLAHQLAEIGVILLMFGVGMHFHIRDLLAVKSVAIPGAIGQSVVATLLSIVVFKALGMPTTGGLVLGLAMSVASTVVLMRVLLDADRLHSPEGHLAVGWLLVEDIFTVIVLVLMPVLADPGNSGGELLAGAGPAAAIGLALFKLAVLVATVMVFGSRVAPWVLVQVARLRSRELFTLTVLVFSIAVATGAYLVFGASLALGAFLAGMVVAQSPVSHQAAADALPLRDAFAVIFFVSVGMLFDPAFLLEQPLMILAALAIILLAKPLAALSIVGVMGLSVRTALTVAVGLAQIGEFSFILSETARKHDLLDEAGHNLLVAAAIITIALNPLLFRTLPAWEAALRRWPRLWNLLSARAEARMREVNLAATRQIAAQGQAQQRLAVVVGYGPVGRSVDRLLREAGLTTVIVDLNMDTISELSRADQTAIFGDASREAILEQAGIEHASHLVLTLPHAADRLAIISAARNLNPKLRILVRARYLREREDLEQAGATAAVFEEGEAAVGLARLVLADTGASRERIERTVRELRLRLILENVSNLQSQSVENIMVPWARVRRLAADASLDQVRKQVAEERYSRWPVVDAQALRPIGYLLAKDLVSEPPQGQWQRLIRPLRVVGLRDEIESLLVRLQRESGSICLIEHDGLPVGILTIEDILEQVIGRIEDEYPRHPDVSLAEALAAGGVVFELSSETAEQAIAELARAISPVRLPVEADVAELAIARERELSTDVGLGAAFPHSRCAGLAGAILVVGRSPAGILFNPQSTEPVRLVFLLVTPAEQPELQVLLLGKLAAVVSDESLRKQLQDAMTPEEIHAILSAVK